MGLLKLKENEKSGIMAPETAKRTAFEKPSRKASQSSASLINVIANEPTIGMYRIQEHIRKTVPKIEKETERFQRIASRFDNVCITLDSISDSVQLVEQG